MNRRELLEAVNRITGQSVSVDQLKKWIASGRVTVETKTARGRWHYDQPVVDQLVQIVKLRKDS